MPNLPIWAIIALIVAAVGVLLLSGALNTPSNKPAELQPAVISIAERLARFSEVSGAAAESLFESPEASLALLHIDASIAPHVHHESHEVLYVLNGLGRARTAEVEYALAPGMMLILFSETPIELIREGDRPLDVLIFLSPPSNESNVTRLDSEQFLQRSQGSLAPILINANEQLSTLSVQAKSIPSVVISNFAKTGNVGLLQLLNGSSLAEKPRAANLLLYVVEGSASAKIARSHLEINAGDFVVIPDTNSYEITTTSDEPLNLIFFAAPVWQAP